MLRNRIIPVLLLHDNGLVKTKRFRKPKYLGDPINVINIFNDKEVDELIFLDIDATRRNKKIDFKMIEDIASECFMPFAYGGGIKKIEEIEKLFFIGVEKVIINSSLNNKKLIEDAIVKFGSQSIVASIDIKKDRRGNYRIYSHKTNKLENINYIDYINEIEELQVGEIFINNVDYDGMMEGYDIELMKTISNSTSVPVVACGGAGNLKDIKELITNTNVSAAAAGSIFVFIGIYNSVLITYPKYNDLIKLIGE